MRPRRRDCVLEWVAKAVSAVGLAVMAVLFLRVSGLVTVPSVSLSRISPWQMSCLGIAAAVAHVAMERLDERMDPMGHGRTSRLVVYSGLGVAVIWCVLLRLWVRH